MADLMSTFYDIIDAKAALTAHVAKHHCRLGDNCLERLRLSRAYNNGPSSAAGRWALDYGDDEKQRAQYHERHKA